MPTPQQQQWLQKLGVAGAARAAAGPVGAPPPNANAGAARQVAAAGGDSSGAAAGRSGADAIIDEFANDDAKTIPTKHIKYLNELHDKLVAAPNATVVLVGHTDTVGKEQYNKDLGLHRAERVRDYLTQDGKIDPDRINIETKGETQPAAGQPPAKRDPSRGVSNPKNRRVEVRIKGLEPASPADAQPGAPADAQQPKPADGGTPDKGGDQANKDADKPDTDSDQGGKPGKAEKKVTLSNQDPIDAAHLGVDVQTGLGTAPAPWSLQAGLVWRDKNLLWNDKVPNIDFLHEPNISLTFDSKGGITAQQAISLINMHWMAGWNREIERSVQLLVNENLNPKLHVGVGVQVQDELHITKKSLSIALSITGTVDDTGSFAMTGQANLLLHLDFVKK